MKVITLKSVHFINNNDSLLNKNECYPFLRKFFRFCHTFLFKLLNLLLTYAT